MVKFFCIFSVLAFVPQLEASACVKVRADMKFAKEDVAELVTNIQMRSQAIATSNEIIEGCMEKIKAKIDLEQLGILIAGLRAIPNENYAEKGSRETTDRMSMSYFNTRIDSLDPNVIVGTLGYLSNPAETNREIKRWYDRHTMDLVDWEDVDSTLRGLRPVPGDNYSQGQTIDEILKTYISLYKTKLDAATAISALNKTYFVEDIRAFSKEFVMANLVTLNWENIFSVISVIKLDFKGDATSSQAKENQSLRNELIEAYFKANLNILKWPEVEKMIAQLNGGSYEWHQKVVSDRIVKAWYEKQ